jgi:hypothetical protein
MSEGYKINDRRGKRDDQPRECCRVCGSKDVHTSHYNQPTMGCIEYLRGLASKAETIRLGTDEPDKRVYHITDADINRMDLSRAQSEIGNLVYESTFLFERLEHRGVLRGNGHHMRQEIAEAAGNLLKERWIQPTSPATQ